MYCLAPGCERPATRRGMCRGHRKQHEAGRPFTPLQPRNQSPFERYETAVRVYDDTSAEDDAAFARNAARLRVARRAVVAGVPRCVTAGCGRRRYALGLCFRCWRESIETFRRENT